MSSHTAPGAEDRQHDDSATEQTPLLNDGSRAESAHDDPETVEGQASKRSIRWPSIIAWGMLSGLAVAVLVLGFVLPSVASSYAQQAAVFEPDSASIESFSDDGVYARVRGTFMLDGDRVNHKPTRDLGRAMTWIASKVQTQPATVEVFWEDEEGGLFGIAQMPKITVSIRDEEPTFIDEVLLLAPGDHGIIKTLAYKYLRGETDGLKFNAKSDVELKSGLFNFGKFAVEHEVILDGKNTPKLPAYNITNINFHEIAFDSGEKAMAVDVSVEAYNSYPVSLTVPPISFDVLVPGCAGEESLQQIARAASSFVKIQPEKMVVATANGIVRSLNDELLTKCPGKDSSPIDILLHTYTRGNDTTVYIRGAPSQSSEIPDWMTEFVKDVELPISFKGSSFGGLIRNFSMENVDFSIPSPFADPNSPDSRPSVSADLTVVANLPREMNFPIDVNRFRSVAEIFYKKRKLGNLDLQHWQAANSTILESDDGRIDGIKIETSLRNAPVNITDQNVFQTVARDMLFGVSKVILDLTASVDVETSSALGTFAVHGIPAEGKVPIQALPSDGLGAFVPTIKDINIENTTADSLAFQLTMGVQNPTAYSASVPFVNVSISNNDSVLAYATAGPLRVVPGDNHEVKVLVHWAPAVYGRELGQEVGRELMSQYISGFNTTLTISPHRGTFPALPDLGEALSGLNITIPTPPLGSRRGKKPGDGDQGPHFIEDATMHLFTSTATFILRSPLKHSIIYLEEINATALFNHTDPMGTIFYDTPIAVPPGPILTPRLPVEWDLGSVAYDAVRDALGGALKLDARAEVKVRLGKWSERLWFKGKGIGAKIRV